jgi:protease-4
MKQFFGAFFGSIIGIIFSTLLAVVILVATIKSSFSEAFKQKDQAVTVKAKSILKLELEGDLIDREKQNPFRDFGDMAPFGGNYGTGLNTLVEKIRAAKEDKNVEGIYLYIRSFQAGTATILELRNALEDFKSSGKFIYSYSEFYSQRGYYLASVASKVFLNPQGGMDWKGLGATLMFFKHAFDKLDLEVQVFRHGKFKSAVEPFLLDKMSQANRYQSEIFLNSIWSSVLDAVGRDRNLSHEELNRMANNLEIRSPEDALGKFVDSLVYEDEVMSALKKTIGMKEEDKLKLVDLGKYELKKDGKEKNQDGKIAIIYATGNITGGEGSDEEIGSEGLSKAIREARLDDKVKAIVLRVNSGGGSALASEIIWREMTLAGKVKPAVVSMGNVAASGGYYIACSADRIFAQPNTITGSIGVFGVLPNFQKLFEKKLGITLDTVNTNKHSDMGSGLRPVSGKEYDYIQNSVEKIYELFTRRVAEGRRMSQSDVDSIGQGRVWTGTDALKIGLVDELGGLNEAVAYAAKKAGLSAYKTIDLPKQKNPFDEFLGKKESDVEIQLLRKHLGPAHDYMKQVRNVLRMNGVQARLPFELKLD